MGARKTDMHRIQELIRLHRLGESSRAIARQLQMGRDTIRCYQQVLDKAGLLKGEAADLPETSALRAVVGEQLPATTPSHQESSAKRWAPKIEKLRAGGAGPTAIHDWLRLHEPEYGCSVSTVKRVCARLSREEGPDPRAVAIPVSTAPGEVAQVDFVYSGKRYDPQAGTLRKT